MTTPQPPLPSDSNVSDPSANEPVTAFRTAVDGAEPVGGQATCVCPCCGAEFAGSLLRGCTACGARAVGPPLASPEIVLPRLGRAVAAFVAGVALLAALLTGTLAELLSGAGADLGFWRVVAAAETAAWRLRWTLLPAAFAAGVAGARYALFARARAGEAPFGGRGFARAGVLSSSAVALLMLLLIGVTIPERLRRREVAREAHVKALEYAAQAAFSRYQARHDNLPDDLDKLRDLPDPDGTIAFVLANFQGEAYTPSSVQAAARAPKPRLRRATRLRTVGYNSNANDANAGEPSGGLTFTNYDLVWAGGDGVLGTADDRIMRDGRFLPAPPPDGAAPATTSGEGERPNGSARESSAARRPAQP